MFYTLSKEQRLKKVAQIKSDVQAGIQKKSLTKINSHFSDEDTYIRKAAYQAIGKIYDDLENLQNKIITVLTKLLKEKNHHIRQAVINAAGGIGMKDFKTVEHFFDQALFDEHHTVRNAVIGSVKKMGQKNPKPVLKWAKKYLQHADKEVRREICHGIELRGRTHPGDILPLLKELQFDKTARVRNTLVHVLGQISYKKGCLETVIQHLNGWENKALTQEAASEIIDVHERYKDFATRSQKEALAYIQKNFELYSHK